MQVQQAAASLHFTGLIGWQQYLSAQDLQARVAQAISKGKYGANADIAHNEQLQ